MTTKKKKERPVMGPASETQRVFLQHDAQFIIYGGGNLRGLRLKTQLQ